MSRLSAANWVVTCDAVGTEHEASWALVEDGAIAAVGAWPEPEAGEVEIARARRVQATRFAS